MQYDIYILSYLKADCEFKVSLVDINSSLRQKSSETAGVAGSMVRLCNLSAGKKEIRGSLGFAGQAD